MEVYEERVDVEATGHINLQWLGQHLQSLYRLKTDHMPTWRGQLVKKSHHCSFGKTKMIINNQYMLLHGNMILLHITVETPQIFLFYI